MAAASASGVRVDGVLISPMRRGGAELLADVVRDPQRSLVLAVAIGGLFIKVLQDSARSGPGHARGRPVACSAGSAAGPYWTAPAVPSPSAWIRYPR